MTRPHKENNDHSHDHNGIFGPRTELYLSLLCGIFLAIGFSIKVFGADSQSMWNYIVPFLIAYGFGGYYITIEAFLKIKKGEFEIDFLMIAAAVGAAYIGSWAEGALLLFLFSLGHALENYAMNKAKKSIEALQDLTPKTALVKRGDRIEEVGVETLKLNDIIVVKPNSKIAADGVIITGNSAINQAPITGESMPVDKTAIESAENLPNFEDIDSTNVVYTGTINGDGSIEVLVMKLSKDSTVARLVKMVSEVETHKSPTQRMTKQFEKWYVPVVIVVVTILCFAYMMVDETFNESLYRAITVLVAASPCALAISTPSAVLSGIARAAQKGVLIKGGKALEDLGSILTIAFDKTGTLTEGKPRLTNVIPTENYDEQNLARIILEVESLSNHPLARAIANGVKSQYQMVYENLASQVNAIHGKGISAIYEDQVVFIGNEKLMTDEGMEVPGELRSKMELLLQEGHTAMLVAHRNAVIGLVSVMDVPRKTAVQTLKRLKEIGIQRMVMLTGDHQNVGDSIAKQIGLTEAKGNLLPEDKVEAVKALMKRDGKIAMVGDGVNDAPAMAYSTVSVAMGAAGSDVALETADVALMSDKIEMLPFAIGLSRASKRIITQNIWISMGVVALLVPATILDFTNIGLAVIFHEGSTLVVVLNALRLLAYDEK
ncbi:MAG TPA: heavy metal translocating P-type ATPase [Gelidibacter sp.]|uniref:heavy metal translocating P-type ATPase n=1 Tax=Gelidibacter sp. TaxID=2018083 RepID=UPI002BBC1BD2|nr:heavy metal translocating P-type ATPase [Gelidibacter sp.]HXJ98358.1 heavy metal translocating P-type ATPase [Gelidibacter sp.]